MKNKTKKSIILATLLIALIALIGMVFAFQAPVVQASAYTNQSTRASIPARETWDKHEFNYNSVNIILTKEASRQFLDYTVYDFSEIGATAINDLTSFTVDYVREQFDFRQSRGFFRYESQRQMMVDAEAFRRMFNLTIEHGSRERVFQIIDILNQRDDVYLASPSLIFELASAASNSAPSFTQEWNQNMKDLIGFDNLAQFQANAPSIIVGIIDGGIQYNHPDLKHRIHRANPDNETIDTTWHRSFVDSYSDFNVTGIEPGPILNPIDTRVRGHGTQVAGIIAAMHPGAQFVCLRVAQVPTATASGAATEWSAQAIIYAQYRNIPILNFSIDGFGACPIISQALDTFTGLFIASAGNEGFNIQGDVHLGNASTRSRVITVGAHNNIGQRSVWSSDSNPELASFINSSNFCGNPNINERNVHIFAPGGGVLTTGGVQHNIRTTTPYPNVFGDFNGTSAAAPFVSGVAALMRAINPDMPLADIRSAIINNAEYQSITVPVSNQFGTIIGHEPQTVRRLNAYAAVSAAREAWIHARFNFEELCDYTVSVSAGDVSLRYFRRRLWGRDENNGRQNDWNYWCYCCGKFPLSDPYNNLVGSGQALAIPSSVVINGTRRIVTEIAEYGFAETIWFLSSTWVFCRLVIPDTVTYIPYNAFSEGTGIAHMGCFNSFQLSYCTCGWCWWRYGDYWTPPYCPDCLEWWCNLCGYCTNCDHPDWCCPKCPDCGEEWCECEIFLSTPLVIRFSRYSFCDNTYWTFDWFMRTMNWGKNFGQYNFLQLVLLECFSSLEIFLRLFWLDVYVCMDGEFVEAVVCVLTAPCLWESFGGADDWVEASFMWMFLAEDGVGGSLHIPSGNGILSIRRL